MNKQLKNIVLVVFLGMVGGNVFSMKKNDPSQTPESSGKFFGEAVLGFIKALMYQREMKDDRECLGENLFASDDCIKNIKEYLKEKEKDGEFVIDEKFKYEFDNVLAVASEKNRVDVFELVKNNPILLGVFHRERELLECSKQELLYIASRNGSYNVVVFLVEKMGVELNWKLNDKDNTIQWRTPIHGAMEKGHLDIALYFHSKGVSFDIVDGFNEKPTDLLSDDNKEKWKKMLKKNKKA